MLVSGLIASLVAEAQQKLNAERARDMPKFEYKLASTQGGFVVQRYLIANSRYTLLVNGMWDAYPTHAEMAIFTTKAEAEFVAEGFRCGS